MKSLSMGFCAIPLLALLSSCSDDSTAIASPVGTALSSSSENSSQTENESAVSYEYAAASGTISKMNVVIRDFQPNHSDFENFSEEAVEHLDDIYNYVTRTGTAMNAFGFGTDWYAAAAYHYTCGNAQTIESGFGVAIGVDGLPMQANTSLPSYLQQTSAGPVLEYGECAERVYSGSHQRLLRGYMNVSESLNHRHTCKMNVWSNPVIATTGMVSSFLKFTQKGTDGQIDMLEGVTISKMSERCDNANFDQWFTDVPSVNKRVNAVLELVKDSVSGDYVFDRGYNNGGFFPLDSIDPVTSQWVMNKPCDPSIQVNGSCEQYEPQSLSIFCPPYNYMYASSQVDEFGQKTSDLCTEWLNQGGPRAVNSNGSGHSAAVKAVEAFGSKTSYLGLQHLRNFHFTMMAYTPFIYETAKQVPTPQVFEFASSGDMWVFVDGVLVADMGGDHMLVPASFQLKTLAENNHGCHAGEPLALEDNCKGASDSLGWADGSVHHLHIFYTNRQTNGSEIYFSIFPADRLPK